MAVLQFLVVLGFTFDPRPGGDNSVLFNRVKLALEVINSANLQAGPDFNYILLSGRGAVRSDFREIDRKKLEDRKFEALIMRRRFEELAARRDELEGTQLYSQKLRNVTFVEDVHSTVTMENMLFSFWFIKKVFDEIGSKVESGLIDRDQLSNEVALTVVTSDFHVVRTTFLLKRVYEAVRQMNVLGNFSFPVLDLLPFDSARLAHNSVLKEKIFSEEVMTLLSPKNRIDQATIAFNDLPSLHKDSKGLCVVGHAEEDKGVDRWESFVASITMNKTKQLLNEVTENWEQFKSFRDLQDEPGLQHFLKEVLTAFLRDFDRS